MFYENYVAGFRFMKSIMLTQYNQKVEIINSGNKNICLWI